MTAITCKLCANALVSWTASFLRIIFSAVKRKQVWTVTFYNVVSKIASNLYRKARFQLQKPKHKPRVLITYVRLTRGTRRLRSGTKQVREQKRICTHGSAGIIDAHDTDFCTLMLGLKIPHYNLLYLFLSISFLGRFQPWLLINLLEAVLIHNAILRESYKQIVRKQVTRKFIND